MMCKCKKHDEEFIIIKVCLSCEKERQEEKENEPLFHRRMFPFPLEFTHSTGGINN